jgi:ATP-dependent DNA helicase RecG
LKTTPGDYEHFQTPFILTVDKTLACIRNLKYRYMVDETTLFPQEVTMYDDWVIREALHNCVAHQDYGKCSRIIVLEYSNYLIFDNAGSFIPASVEEAIRYDRPQRHYRNPLLVSAMVNLNMIDVIGSGIKKMFTIQRERFFPLPTYNISDKEHTEVTIHGKLINESYSRLLKKHPELSLDDVIALDKIHKNIPVSETELQRLRDLKLVAGLASELQVAGNYAKISYQEYKQMILNLITLNDSATRDDIVNLIMPTLSPDEPIEKRQRKITNIIARLSKQEKIIKNTSTTDKYPVWIFVGDDEDVDAKIKK